MIITKQQLQQLIDEEFSRAIEKRRSRALTEARQPVPSEDDAENAQSAEYGLDTLGSFFQDNEVISKAYDLVMTRLRKIQQGG